jgi:hypothetical protein
LIRSKRIVHNNVFLSLGIPPVDSDFVVVQLRECCKALKTLVNNPKSFPDVTFVVGSPPTEIKEIPAHKAILLARAPQLLKYIVRFPLFVFSHHITSHHITTLHYTTLHYTTLHFLFLFSLT